MTWTYTFFMITMIVIMILIITITLVMVIIDNNNSNIYIYFYKHLMGLSDNRVQKSPKNRGVLQEFGIELLSILAGTWINFPMPRELQSVKDGTWRISHGKWRISRTFPWKVGGFWWNFPWQLGIFSGHFHGKLGDVIEIPMKIGDLVEVMAISWGL